MPAPPDPPERKHKLPVADGSVETDEVDTRPADEALMKLARDKPFHDSSMSEDEQLRALNDSSNVQAKLQDRLSILEIGRAHV